MPGKYIKNVIITFAIVATAWMSTSYIYKTRKKLSDMTDTISNLSAALEQSKQENEASQSELKSTQDKMSSILTEQKRQETLRQANEGTTQGSSTQNTTSTIITPTVTTSPVVQNTTPAYQPPVQTIRVIRPSRVSRAS